MQKLSPAQRTSLQLTLNFRDRPLTIWAMFAANRVRYAILVATGCLVISLLYVVDVPMAAALLGAFITGALLRDVGWFRQQIIGWPLTCAIIDWQRVEQLVTSDKPIPDDDHPSNPLLDS